MDDKILVCTVQLNGQGPKLICERADIELLFDMAEDGSTDWFKVEFKYMSVDEISNLPDFEGF